MASDLRDWIGREAEVEDVLDRRTARRMQSLMRPAPALAEGDALPPLWCWLYFHAPAPLDALGRDGHAAKGGFLPPVPLPRRMWAGGRFEFPGTLRIGRPATRRSRILDVAEKTGRSGALCFVTVEHAYAQGGVTAWREEHDIVYREDPAPGSAPPPSPPAPGGATDRETVTPSPVMLFRYSALTFNGHRIHYDRDYAREVEGYRDLVFHGPLTATLLADLADRRTPGRLARFDYRARAPLFDTAPFGIALDRGATTRAWAATPDGRLAMTAEAQFERD
ncbi:MAG: MaoC family dehydratase N-terminal domain-containing protein [Pseudomonadota bacterium]